MPWPVQYEYVQLINNRLCIAPTEALVVRANESSESECNNQLVHPHFVIEDTKTTVEAKELQLGIPGVRLFESPGHSFIKNQLTRLNNASRQEMKIPRIIHHICDYPNGTPKGLLDLAATWKKHHPEWEQRFWDRQQMDEFVHTVCPDFEPYYRAYPHNIQRWDAVRYLILYHIGGMYVDLDYQCFLPFDSVLSGHGCCIVTEPDLNAKYANMPHILSNALMAAAPGSSFMRKVIEELKSQNSASFSHLETYKIILSTTGPYMLTRVYDALISKKQVTLLPTEIFMPLTPKEVMLARQGRSTKFIDYKLSNAFAVHYFENSW